MNKKHAEQCESCTEQTKQLVFCDGKDNISWRRWMCQNTECPYNDMAEKQKSATEKRKEAQEINRKNGVDVRKLIKLRILAQFNLAEAREIVGISSAQYRTWEWGKEPIPADKYNVLIDKFSHEISNQKCNNCYFYNGEPGDGKQFCDKKEEDVTENYKCILWTRRDAT